MEQVKLSNIYEIFRLVYGLFYAGILIQRKKMAFEKNKKKPFQ